ncbi:hypothetical protein ABKV19_018382 [Rosa sericea]
MFGSLFFHVVPVKSILSSWSLLHILVCRCEKETVLFPTLTTVPILGECPKTYWGTIVNKRLRMMWLPVLSFCVGTKSSG